MLALSGCYSMSFGGHTTLRGNRAITSQTVAVDGEGSFALEIEGFSMQNFTPTLTVDERLGEYEGVIVIRADDNLHEYITVDVRDNRIVIRSQNRVRMIPSELHITTALPIDNLRLSGAWRAYVTCTRVENFTANCSGSTRGEFMLGELDRLDLNGSGSARFAVHATANDVRVNISGSGRVTLNGAAESADLRISGSGNVEAFDFPVQTARVNISGSGRVDIAVEQELDVDVSGSGRVTYDGDPHVRSRISGSGRITAR